MGKRQSGENVRTARRARSDPRVEHRGIWPANVRRVARRGARRFEPKFEIRKTPSMSPRVKSDPATETRAQERSARRDVGRASENERARDVHAAIRRDARDFLREDEKRKTRRIVVP